MKTMTFYKTWNIQILIRSHKCSLQLRSRFPLLFMFINTSKVPSIVYRSLVSINLDVVFFFCFRCYKMYFLKLITTNLVTVGLSKFRIWNKIFELRESSSHVQRENYHVLKFSEVERSLSRMKLAYFNSVLSHADHWFLESNGWSFILS